MADIETTTSALVRSADDAAALGTVLGVWAHPDDEAYLSGALMSLARDAGSRVAVVTATLGEHGTPDPQRFPPHRLREIREVEHRDALAALGVDEFDVLGYRDGGCHEAAERDAVASITHHLERVRPDTVVTFGPDGMTGHRDHRAVGRWTTAAWERAGRAGRLLHATHSTSFMTEFADVHERFDVFGPGGCTGTPDHELAVRIVPRGEVLERKLAALRAHASQTGPLIEAMGEARYREWLGEECFVDAALSGDGARSPDRG